MWWMNSIIDWLNSIEQNFLDAYNKVVGWTWPFNNLAPPLYYIYRAFYWLTIYFGEFNTWLVSTVASLAKILDINQITSYFQTWINYATQAITWIYNAGVSFTFAVNTWWNTTQQTVLVWIENTKQWLNARIDSLNYYLSLIWAEWNSFVSKIPSLNEILLWFTNWWANVLSHLSSWWTERLLDIKALLNSWTLDLAPFWAGWQEIRDKVFEFFNDPLEWLLAEFTDWFLGKE